MTLTDFISENNLKPVEWVDPTNPNQCVDLVAKWIEHGLGLPRLTNGITYAYQLFTNPTQGLKDNFEFIPNGDTNFPGAGDIVVWGKAFNGTAGHTGVATGKGDIARFDCFVQNDPLRSYCHVKTYTYFEVLGWLHYKFSNTMQDNVVRKSSFFDVIWLSFKGADTDTDHATRAEVDAFVAWIKSNVARAGKWDRICQLAGIVGDTNEITTDAVRGLLQSSDPRLEEIKQRLVEIANSI